MQVKLRLTFVEHLLYLGELVFVCACATHPYNNQRLPQTVIHHVRWLGRKFP